MPSRFLWRILLGIIIIATAGGCSLSTTTDGSNSGIRTEGPAFSLLVGDSELAGSSGRQLSEAYKPGNSLYELLKSSGVATFAADGSSILSVNKVFLSPEWVWEIQVNSKKITDWNSGVDREDNIIIAAKPAAGGSELQPVILSINGGSEQTELTHSYVQPYTENLTVRSMLKGSEMVQLAEDNKTVTTVMDYTPLSNEAWKLKVNGKPLLDSGIDMKLRPQDTLEIQLALR